LGLEKLKSMNWRGDNELRLFIHNSEFIIHHFLPPLFIHNSEFIISSVQLQVEQIQLDARIAWL
jgi:hypothetical protein